jgi:hypothetical protein
MQTRLQFLVRRAGSCQFIAFSLILFTALGPFFAASPASAQEQCMDCAERVTTRSDGVVVSEALCCDAPCAGGYSVVDPDVGWGCRIATIPSGERTIWNQPLIGTVCASESVANACEGAGGGMGPDPDNQDAGAEPLILDLNGDGIWTTSLEESPVLFDITGNGVADLTAWIDARTEDAFLYFDLNQNHRIDGGQELFGDATLLPGGQPATTGYQALAAYDAPRKGGNGDGVISPADGVWGNIRLWFDRNHDGQMTRDEDYSLGSRGVVEIALAYTRMAAADQYGVDLAGNYHFLQGTFKQRIVTPGTGAEIVERRAHDVWFRAVIH